ncbi:MAG TPA: Gx transporter family protein [Gammaproteobacteria bacterium]
MMHVMDTAAQRTGTRDDRLIAGFAALAIGIHILESAVPMPLPGMKPGLANVVVLIVLLRYGFRMAAAVMFLRVIVGSIFIGTFLTPTFFLSLAGALSSIGVAGMIHVAARQWTGPVGFAIAMSMAHISGQFLVAYWLFVPHPVLLNLLPVLLAVAMGLGAITGIIAASIIERLPARTE